MVKILIDRNSLVRLNFERAGVYDHNIKLIRTVDNNEEVLIDQEIANGANNRLDFEFGGISTISYLIFIKSAKSFDLALK